MAGVFALAAALAFVVAVIERIQAKLEAKAYMEKRKQGIKKEMDSQVKGEYENKYYYIDEDFGEEKRMRI